MDKLYFHNGNLTTIWDSGWELFKHCSLPLFIFIAFILIDTKRMFTEENDFFSKCPRESFSLGGSNVHDIKVAFFLSLFFKFLLWEKNCLHTI